ncbi:hypothetical protein V8E36_002875 [Tilletia maclaganii]
MKILSRVEQKIVGRNSETSSPPGFGPEGQRVQTGQWESRMDNAKFAARALLILCIPAWTRLWTRSDPVLTRRVLTSQPEMLTLMTFLSTLLSSALFPAFPDARLDALAVRPLSHYSEQQHGSRRGLRGTLLPGLDPFRCRTDRTTRSDARGKQKPRQTLTLLPYLHIEECVQDCGTLQNPGSPYTISSTSRHRNHGRDCGRLKLYALQTSI